MAVGALSFWAPGFVAKSLVRAARCVLAESGPTCRRCVSAAPSPLSSTTGSIWASWPCYH